MRKIDAVITWVDGSDPAHRAKRLQAMQNSKPLSWNASMETRFGDTGEIYFCIASILKYAPFIRKIFIVTDAQAPEGIEYFFKNNICGPEKIQIIDHTEIFDGFSDYLPTFNSLSIETMLWRIPNLSDEFIYFNDDFFLMSESQIEDFVLPDKNLVLYGEFRSVWPSLFRAVKKHVINSFKDNKTSKFSHSLVQANAAYRLGKKHFLSSGHAPHALRKSTFLEYFSENFDVLTKQIEYKFRSRKQFNPIALANTIELSKKLTCR